MFRVPCAVGQEEASGRLALSKACEDLWEGKQNKDTGSLVLAVELGRGVLSPGVPTLSSWIHG